MFTKDNLRVIFTYVVESHLPPTNDREVFSCILFTRKNVNPVGQYAFRHKQIDQYVRNDILTNTHICSEGIVVYFDYKMCPTVKLKVKEYCLRK